jgi:hypothetical protein
VPTSFDRATVPYLLFAVCWGIALVLSFAGWGGTFFRLLRLRKGVDAGLAAALGLALTVAAWGIGNLAGLLSRGAALVWVAAGLAGFALDRFRSGRSGGSGARPATMPAAAALLVMLLALFHVAGSVDGHVFDGNRYRPFDPHDDLQAYLAFPLKMLETGGLGADPFEARRLPVLGGQSALQALALAALPPRAIHLLDAGAGLLVSLWVLLGAVRAAALPRKLAALPLLFMLLLPSLPARGNTTALFTGTALLLALYRLVDEEAVARESPARGALPAGVVLAALVALKSTFLPAAVLFVAAAALATPGDRRGRRFVEAAATGAWALLLLIPWMVSLKLSSGTFFFPFLGAGNQTVNWDVIPGLPPPATWRERATLALSGLREAIPVALLLPLAYFRSRRPAVLALGLAVLALPAAYRLVGDPFLDRSLSRYFFPAFAWAVSLLVIAALRGPASGDSTARLAGAAALAVSAGILASDAGNVARQLRQLGANVASSVAGRELVPWGAEARALSLLDAVPAGAAVLERLPEPYLLDFRAHRVLLFSMPGITSPPPGMPFAGGPEKVASYLERQGVRYLAYGSRTDDRELLELTESDISFRYPRARSRWAFLGFHREFHRTVHELSFTRARLADRPDGVVLDLAARALRLPLLEAPERLEGFTSDGWSAGSARIRLDYERTREDRFLRVVLAPPGRDVRVSVDGRALPMARRDPSALVFDLSGAPDRLGGLSLEGSAVEVLGIATVARAEDAPRIGPAPQRVDASLEIPHAEWRSGFWADDWTGGNGILPNLDWPVPAGTTELAVEIGAGPPGPPEAAGLRVVVNGTELEGIGAKDGVYAFRIPPGLSVIRRIRIVSKTFVPNEAGQYLDGRRLGVAVARVFVR